MTSRVGPQKRVVFYVCNTDCTKHTDPHMHKLKVLRSGRALLTVEGLTVEGQAIGTVLLPTRCVGSTAAEALEIAYAYAELMNKTAEVAANTTRKRLDSVASLMARSAYGSEQGS